MDTNIFDTQLGEFMSILHKYTVAQHLGGLNIHLHIYRNIKLKFTFYFNNKH